VNCRTGLDVAAKRRIPARLEVEPRSSSTQCHFINCDIVLNGHIKTWGDLLQGMLLQTLSISIKETVRSFHTKKNEIKY
jgi:hypothetical protein